MKQKRNSRRKNQKINLRVVVTRMPFDQLPLAQQIAWRRLVEMWTALALKRAA